MAKICFSSVSRLLGRNYSLLTFLALFRIRRSGNVRILFDYSPLMKLAIPEKCFSQLFPDKN